MGLIGYYIIAGIMFIAGLIVSGRLKGKFAEYSQIDHGIYNIRVISTPGHLSDHYNPQDRTVNLSEDVYYGRSVSAAAVAAHECGHAVQHARSYSMLQFRSAIVPLVNISSQLSQWVILAGLGFMFGAANPTVLLVGIVLFAITTLFTIITLPVEYDASDRALRWLVSKNMTTDAEQRMAADALKWAARTYVVAAISSVATLFYYILLFVNSRDRD